VHQEENLGLAGTIVMGEGAPMSPFAAAAPRPAAGAAAHAPAPVAAAPAPVAATPAPLAAANQPTAARRANRGGASVDVFAAAQETREHGDRPRPPTPGGKLGERNENSVLFSLSALTATETAAAKSSSQDAPFDLGLGNGRSGGSNNFDDLMNMGGGAIGGPMLAPPPLLAPVVEPPPAAASAPIAQAPVQAMGAMSPMMAIPAPPPKSKTGLIIGIVAAVVVLGSIGAVFALGGSKGSGSGGSGESATVSSGQPSSAVTTAAPSMTVSSAPPPTDTPVASGSPTASSAVGSGDSGGKTPVGGTGPAPTGKASSAASTTPTASAKTSADPTPTPTPTATAAADPGAGGRDFNKGAATTALSAAANSAKGCKQAGGPTGSASVRVVFAPSGNVTSANVQGPPFAGTPVGGCIASAFRGAHVPPFDGSPVAVSKTVNIN
jgi:hypothetical protein